MKKILAAVLAAAIIAVPAALPGGSAVAAEGQKIIVPKGKGNAQKARPAARAQKAPAKKVAPVGRGGNVRGHNTHGRNVNNRNVVVRNNYYYRGNRYGWRGYGWGGGYYYGGLGAAAAVGLATGAVIGAAAAQPERVYVAPDSDVPPAAGYAPFSPGYMEHCSSKYRSFDPQTGTYLGYDGYRHYCQ